MNGCFVSDSSTEGLENNAQHWYNFLTLQILNHKVEVEAKSKVGSMDNVKHRPGGGDKQIFNDVEYLRQKSATSTSTSNRNSANSSRRQSASQASVADEEHSYSVREF